MERMKRSRVVATCFVFFIAMLALIGVFATTGIGRSNKPAEAATTYTLNITVTNATTNVYSEQSYNNIWPVDSVIVTFGDASKTISGTSGSATLVSTTNATSIGFTLTYDGGNSVSTRLQGSRSIGNPESISGQNTECNYNTGWPNYINYKGNVYYNATTSVAQTKENPTVTAPTAITGLTYTGSAQTLINAGSTTGGTLQYNVDGGSWSTSIPTGTNAKTSYSVGYKVVGDDNYNDVAAQYVNVSIAKANNPLAFTSTQSVSKTFSTSSQTASLTAATNGQGTVTYSIQSQKNSSNANVTFFSLSGTTLTLAASTTADTYTVVVRAGAAGNDNYNSGTKDSTVTVTVSRANITPSVTMNGWTYGGAASNPSVSGNSGSGAVTYQYKVSTAADSTYTSTKPSNAGTYTVKASVAQTTNYNAGTATKNFTIGTASLTITAKPKTVTYGDAPANDGVTYSGFVNSETQSVLSGALSYSYTYAQYGDVGSYVITPSGVSSNNYSITFNTGVLTVNKKALTITAGSSARQYNGSALTNNTYVSGNLVSDDAITSVTLIGSQTVAGSSNNVASAAVIKRNNVDKTANYNITYVNGTLEITQATTNIVTVSLAGWTYGDSANAPVSSSTFGNGTITYSDAENGVYVAEVPVNAGAWYVKASVAETENYVGGTAIGTFVIARKGLTVTADDKNKTYRDADPALTATIVGLVGTDSENLITYTLTRGAGENVGEYVITPAGNAEQGNYAVTYVAGTFTIGQRTIVDPTITLSRSSYPYDDTQDAAPRVTVTDTDGNVVVAESEYSVVYSNNRYPGSASDANAPSATVSDVVGGNYIITFTTPVDATVTFTITPGQSYIEEVPKAVMGMIYNGNARELITAGTASSGTVKYRIGTSGEWDVAVPTAIDAGTYIVYYKVEGNANYNDWNGGSENGQSLTVIIAPKAVTVAIDNKTKVYDNDSTTDPGLTAVVSGVLLGDAFDYTLTREGGQNAADYVISAVLGDNPNYDVQVTNGIFAITKKPLTITADSDSKSYDGSALTKHTYQDTGVAESDHIESVDFVGSQTVVGECANAPENALILCGERDVTANYDITYVNGLLTVDYAAITDVSVAQIGEMQYNSQNQRATVSASATAQGGQEIAFTYCATEDGVYGGEVPEFSTIGEHTVYYIVSADEHNPESGSFVVTIDRKDITGALITLGERLIYTGEEQTQTIVSVIIDGLNVTYTVSGDVITDAGEYTLTVSGTGNFVGEVSKDFVVAQRDITIVVEAKSKTYGDADPEWTANVLNNTGADDIEYTLFREEGEDAGEYAIRAILGENAGYSIVVMESTLTINPRAIGVAWSTEEFVYNGQEQTPTATATGLAFDDEVILNVTGGTDAGTHTATATFAVAQNNYVLPVGTTVYTIAPKAVTVTVDSKTSVYGSAQVTLTATDDGIVEGDVAYSLSCIVSATSNVGTYDITATALSDNYVVTFENEENAYTVTKKQITVTAEAKNRVYGDVDPALTYTVRGLVNGDEVRGALMRRAGENVGRYAIEKGTIDAGDNYEIAYVPADFVITKKALSVIAKDMEILLGDDAPEYTAVIRGFVLDDDKSVLTGALTFTCGYEKGDDIGSYTITPRGLSSGNYDIAFIAGTLTVKPIVIDTKEVQVTIYNEEGEKEEGFDLDIALQVEVKTSTKEKDQESARQEIPEAANLGEKELVAAIYNVKLIRTVTENGLETVEEIQPDDIKPGTSIVVAMQVPESVGSKNFRVVHVHSETDVEEVEYRREGDTVYVTVNRLSDFAFVVEDTRVQVGELKINRVAFIVILVFLLLILLLAIIIYILYRRGENRKYRYR